MDSEDYKNITKEDVRKILEEMLEKEAKKPKFKAVCPISVLLNFDDDTFKLAYRGYGPGVTYIGSLSQLEAVEKRAKDLGLKK